MVVIFYIDDYLTTDPTTDPTTDLGTRDDDQAREIVGAGAEPPR